MGMSGSVIIHCIVILVVSFFRLKFIFLCETHEDEETRPDVLSSRSTSPLCYTFTIRSFPFSFFLSIPLADARDCSLSRSSNVSSFALSVMQEENVNERHQSGGHQPSDNDLIG